MTLDDEGPNWRAIGVVVALVLLGGLAFATLGTRVAPILSTVGAAVGPPDGGYEVPPQEPGAGQVPEDPVAEAPDVPLYSVDRSDLLIIKTGSLTLQVSAIDPALADATNLVSSLGGYASGSDRTGDGDRLAATITFRVPAPKWEEAFVRLRGLAVRVLAEHSETQDVTGQVVDLGARIRNLGATERALQAIMDRAGTIKDVLSVQGELTNVRGQIEELTAQKTHLEEQAALSTLAVTFSMKPEPVLGPVVPGQGRDDVGLRRATSVIPMLGEDAGIRLAGDDVADNPQPRSAAEIAEDDPELQVHLEQRFMHALHVDGRALHQCLPVAQVGPQSRDGGPRAEAAAQQPHAVQLLQPLAIDDVSLPPGHVLDVARVHKEHVEPARLEDFVERDPVHAGGLHRHRRDATGHQPVGQAMQIGREGRERPHRRQVALRRHGDVMGFGAAINTRGVGIDPLQECGTDPGDAWGHGPTTFHRTLLPVRTMRNTRGQGCDGKTFS